MKVFVFGLVTAFLSLCSVGNAQSLYVSAVDAEAIALEAYIYGYPLVTMEMTRKVMTNVSAPTTTRAPMGQFANLREYPTASFKDVTAPNADTLYSSAWVDLSYEPYILHIPDEKGRYYLMPMLDGWTNVFADPGTRITGTKEEDIAIVGPNWHGVLPPKVKEYKSPTNLVWILGRTYSTGTADDYKLVHEIQDQYSLVPLNAYGKKIYSPVPGVVDPNVDMTTPVRDQVNKMDAGTFFKMLATSMKGNPPAVADAPIVAKMARIGIVPGKEFDMSRLDPKVASAVESVPKLALEKILAHQKSAGRVDNGWMLTTKAGTYGTDYLQRAYIAYMGLGANLPQDAIYPVTSVDSSGKPLSGANKYTIHFPKGQTPPVNGFWSLTMYNSQMFFVDNSLNKYTLSPRNPLVYNKDGSLDLYIQNANPGRGKEANWLPAPADNFTLMLRLYWPKDSVASGIWKPPAVQKVH